MNIKNVKECIKEHQNRIITSAIMFAVVVCIVLVDSVFLTWAFLGIVYMMAFHEAYKLFDLRDKRLYVIALIVWVLCAWYPQPILLSVVTLIMLTAAMLQQNSYDTKILFPFIYPTVSMTLLLTLYLYFGILSLLWLVLIVSSCDIFAYIIGKKIGKKQFSLLSPNKTWEGVKGGIVVATIVGTISGMYMFSFWTSLTVSIAVSVTSVWGDLFESYLKRQADVKDSGSILPGHGGILDRADGYLFAGPMMLILLEGLV